MRAKKKVLSIFLMVCMVLVMIPTVAFAEGGTGSVSFNAGISVADGTTPPESYGVDYWVVDEDGTVMQGEGYSGNIAASTGQVTLNNLEDGWKIKFRVLSAGLGIRLNGNDVSADGWDSEKTMSISEVNGKNFEFELFTPAGDPGPGDPGDQSGTGELRFTCKSQMVTGGSVYYKFNNAGEFLQVSEDGGQYGTLNLTDDVRTLTIKFVPKDGYCLDAVRGIAFRVNGSTKESANGIYVDDFISESGHTFDLYDLVGQDENGNTSIQNNNFELEFGFESENGGGPGPGQPQGNTKAVINYDFDGEFADVVVNGNWIEMPSQEDMADQKVQTFVSFDTEESDTTVTIKLGVLFISEFTEVKINDIDYSAQIPKTDEELVDAFEAQRTWVTIENVPRNIVDDGTEIYNISTKTREAQKIAVGNFLWSYDEDNKYQRDQDGNILMDENGNPVLNDDYIDHGRIDLLGVTYNGITYSGDDLLEKIEAGTAFDWNDDEIDGTPVRGGATLPAGAVLTVKLIPEYGYQLTSFGINGGVFDTSAEQSTFKFTVPRGNFHLGAVFSPVEDKVASSSRAVTGGSVQLGSDEINSGSAVLSVKDAVLTEEQKAAFATAGGSSYEISTYLDISLDQVLYKGTGNENDVWSNPLGKETELKTPATVTLKLNEGVDGNNVVILHEKHDGTYEEIKAVYDAVNQTLTFTTSSFSNYAIASKVTAPTDVTGSIPSGNPTESSTGAQKVSPKTGDNSGIVLYFVILFAAAGCLVTMRTATRKK